MTIRNLEHLLQPASVALIAGRGRLGSSGHIARIVARNLVKAPFAGRRFIVGDVGGSDATAASGSLEQAAGIAALPIAPDLAVITAEPGEVPGLVAELGARGTTAAILITESLNPALTQAALQAARPTALRLLGANTLGLMVPALGLDASYSHVFPAKGDVALISQSGALITAMADWATERGIGLSHAISVGDMADVDLGDLLDYLASVPTCRSILLYVEKVKEARKFMSAARRAARSKPVIAVKSGRRAAGRRAAASHSGVLLGSDDAYDAAFRRAGILRVDDLHDLFDAAEMLSRNPNLQGERLAVLTNSGGAGVLAADRMDELGGTLAELSTGAQLALDAVLPPGWSKGNPVDLASDADAARYQDALQLLLSEPQVDAVLVLNCPNALADQNAIAQAVIETHAGQRGKGRPVKPVFTAWLGDGAADRSREAFAQARIASFETPADAIGGYMRLIGYARAQEQLMRMPPALAVGSPDLAAARAIIAAAREARRSMLSEVEAKALFAAHGIPVVETAVAVSPADVERVAAGFLAHHPLVVVKVLSDDITHKSEVGGVRLGLASAADARLAAEDIAATVARRMPGARIAGFSVQPQVRLHQAQELLLGMSVDPVFGPMMVFGAGGTEVEALGDTALGLPPLDINLARDMIRQTRVFRVLAGHRGRPACDVDGIARVLVQLSGVVATHEEILEIDINPLLANSEAAVALDARVRLAMPGEPARTPLAIRPYPSQWERTYDMPAGGKVLLRPIRPEDEALYEDFFERVSQADLRLRFFTPHPSRAHKFLARLTQIDYAREIAFAAVDGEGRLLGVSRFIADPDFVSGEYAVLIRSDLKGQGLGWALMQQLIAFAKAEGLKDIHGLVLAENTTMLGMCRDLGFVSEPDPDDISVRRVRLDLSR